MYFDFSCINPKNTGADYSIAKIVNKGLKWGISIAS